MHVLLVNQPFHPDVAATAQHLSDLAHHLAARGHRVTAIASRTFYGTDTLIGPAYERFGPGGRIDVHRLRPITFRRRTTFAKAVDWSSFYAAAAVKMQQLPPADAVLALSTPPMISVLGALQKRFRARADGGRVRFYYWLMDLYPEAAVTSGMLAENHPLTRLFRGVTGHTLGLADGVLSLGRDMTGRLLTTYRRHVRPERVHLVRPWADGTELFPVPRAGNPMAAELNLGDAFAVVYSGNLGVAHDAATIAAAVERMKDDVGTLFLFVGGGKRFADLRDRAATQNWPHVRFLPFQDRRRLNASLNLADVHLVAQLPAFTGVVVPSKLFGILAVGRPAVVIGPPDAEVSRIVAESRAGIVVPNGDVDALVAALRGLRADPTRRAALGRNARVALETRFDRAIACGHIERVLMDHA